jgi:hypothetical protein
MSGVQIPLPRPVLAWCTSQRPGKRTGARSSTGQSTGLLSRRLQVRVLPGAPICPCRDGAAQQQPNGGRSSVGRVLDCDSSRRGFESHRPPHFSAPAGAPSCRISNLNPFGLCGPIPAPGPLAQLVEQWTLNPLVVGSIPTRPTRKDACAMRGHFFAYRDVGTSRSARTRGSDAPEGTAASDILSSRGARTSMYLVGTVALAHPVLRDIRTSRPSSRSARTRGSDASASAIVSPGGSRSKT